MSPLLVDACSTYCPDCCWWYFGNVTEREFLSNDEESGTALRDCETYTLTIAPCGCDVEDMEESPRMVNKTWKCGSCTRIWGDELAKALACCNGSLKAAPKTNTTTAANTQFVTYNAVTTHGTVQILDPHVKISDKPLDL